MRGSCDILIRSCHKDFAWLTYCLRSVERYCSGFRRVILVVPERSLQQLRRINPACDLILTCPNYRDDYLGQQVTKMLADTFTDADYICHVDSDCIFRRPVIPKDLFRDERVLLFMRSYKDLPANVPWPAVTRKFLGRDSSFDFMQRQPQTFPRWLYAALRKHCLGLHGIELEDYITTQPHRGFSEFNALGAYAYYYHHDRFEYIDLNEGRAPEAICHCYWSWGGIESFVEEIEETIAGRRTSSAQCHNQFGDARR